MKFLLDLESLYPDEPFTLDGAITQPPWLIRGVWQQGKINLMSGLPKSGKSRLMNWLLVGAMFKPSVLDLAVDYAPRRVLYLAAEEVPPEIAGRMGRYAAQMGVNPRETEWPIVFKRASGVQLEAGSYQKWMEAKIVSGEFDTLVFDPLRRVTSADENDSSAVAPILNELRRWSNRYGITIIGIHHSKKPSEFAPADDITSFFRGSSDIASIVDTGQNVIRQTTNARGPATVVMLREGRFAPMPPLKLLDAGDQAGDTWRVKLSG